MSEFFPVVSGGGVTEERLLDKTFALGITCDTNPGDLAVAFSTNDCRYDKIGKIVRVSINLAFTLTYTASTGASGQLSFTGFPFAAETNNALSMLPFQSGSAFTWPNTATMLAMAVQSGSNIGKLQGNKSGSALSNATVALFTSGTAYVLRFRGDYKSAA